MRFFCSVELVILSIQLTIDHVIIMSFLIQQLDAYFQSKLLIQQEHNQIQKRSNQTYLQQITSSEVQIEEQVSYVILPSTKIMLRKRGVFSHKKSLMRIQVQTIVGENNYLKVQERDRQMLLYQLSINKKKSKCEEFIQISLHPKSGIMKIVLLTNFASCLSRPQEVLRAFLRGLGQLKGLKELINYGLTGKIFQQSSRKLTNFQRIITKLGSGLKNNQYQAQSKMESNRRAQKVHRQKILENLMELTKEEANLISLYSPIQFLNTRWGSFFSEEEINHIFAQKIRSPVLNKPRAFYQNSSILNFIKINNQQSLKMSRLKGGGLSSLFLTQIEYWYVFSGTQNDPITPIYNDLFPPDTMLRKVVLLKHESQTNTLRNRIKHEKEILKMMKNGQALFVPKYYQPLKQPAVSRDLFIDFVPAPTLEEYLVINRASLSLPSKILILLMIVHGVRFIHGFEITHLDLKPQNILLLKNMMPKIIDFGESYHAKVCKEEFVPGFTHPYGAPECYFPTNLEIFGPHNDVFSLGVISFQLFFSRYPFYCHNQLQLDNHYINLPFENYFYLCSEAREDCGDIAITSLLQLLIGRCLDVDPGRRPDLNWTSLLLREILDYFYFYYL